MTSLTARYYSIPHLLIPLPLLLLLPPTLHALGLSRGANLVISMASVMLLGVLVLSRLPRLFKPRRRESPRLMAALLLLYPMMTAVLASESWPHRTTSIGFENLARAQVHEYYRIALPRAADFSRLQVVGERRFHGPRGSNRFEVTTALDYGPIGAGRLVLVERPVSEFGPGEVPEERYQHARQSMVSATAYRFGWQQQHGPVVVKRLLPEDIAGGFSSDDVLLEWHVESPEETLAWEAWLGLAGYLLYCTLCVFSPMLQAEEPEAVEKLLQEKRVWRRLFCFRDAPT